MRLSLIRSIAIASLAVSAYGLRVPGLLDELQQTLKWNEGVDFIGQSLEKGQDRVVSAIAKYMNEPLTSIPKATKELWVDMITQFPETVSKLSFKSHPKKVTKAGKFDYVVLDTKVPNHQLRIKSAPEDLGLDKVKQYTGYLDVEDEDKHFFYWFFESRNDPKKDPIILWLNGGPGCSSLTGLFFELGPSSIGPDLKPIHNPYSWNTNASVIFLDQPINVGYSYSSSTVSNTVAAGKDVYAFLELFFKQFPEYSKQDFHIAGESYAGHYIPVFAKEILSHEDRGFNLTSVLIGNGLTHPLEQYKYYQPMACGKGGEPSVLNPEECDEMESSIPRCLSMIEGCYETESVWTCVPATIYCNNAQMGPYQRTGKNVYDIRKQCGDSALCYDDLQYVEEYLNLDEVKENVGAEVDSYEGCNFDINRNFLFAGDWMKPYQRQVTELLDLGLPVLIYAGDKDFICNWLGNQAWTNELEWSHHSKFEAQPIKTWSVNKKEAGEVKNYENFTFLRVFGGGHMVPYDQPENSLAMVNSWVNGDFAFKH